MILGLCTDLVLSPSPGFASVLTAGSKSAKALQPAAKGRNAEPCDCPLHMMVILLRVDCESDSIQDPRVFN